MRTGLLAAAGVMVAASGVLSASGTGLAPHMAAHVTLVALAAPLLSLALAGSAADPAARWPKAVSPLPMSLVEGAAVWAWHLPGPRGWAESHGLAGLAEAATFLVAGVLLWSAVLGGRGDTRPRRAAGIVALLFTATHMTLLGVLIGAAPRPLYDIGPARWCGQPLTPLVDQQLGGVLMLAVGVGSCLAGAMAVLSGLLRHDDPPEAAA